MIFASALDLGSPRMNTEIHTKTTAFPVFASI